jgi:hypothetical protein
MNKKIENHNPLLEIAELKLYIDEDELQSDSWVYCDLRFGSAELEFGDNLYLCGVRRVELSLNLEGCDMERGSKFNDEEISDVSEIIKSHVEKKGELSGGLSLSLQKLIAGLKFGIAKIHTDTAIREISRMRKLLRSLTGLRWQAISTNESDPNQQLDGTYLSNKPIVRLVESDKPSNRLAVTATLATRRRELVVTTEDNFGKSSPIGRRDNVNKERILGVILSKAISGVDKDGKPLEKFTISQSEVQ